MTSAKDSLRQILGKTVRIVLLDGRVIDGSLECMDKDLNFILGSASEFHGVTDGNLCSASLMSMHLTTTTYVFSFLL